MTADVPRRAPVLDPRHLTPEQYEALVLRLVADRQERDGTRRRMAVELAERAAAEYERRING